MTDQQQRPIQTPQRWRKKPVAITAMKFDGSHESACAIEAWGGKIRVDVADHGLYINTLEGRMLVGIGDYVICGVQGELYPCKPDIFEATYEAVCDCHLEAGDSPCRVHDEKWVEENV